MKTRALPILMLFAAVALVATVPTASASDWCVEVCTCESSCSTPCSMSPGGGSSETCGDLGFCTEGFNCTSTECGSTQSCTTTISGSSSADTLTGTSAHECIDAYGGDDTVYGGAGDDTIGGDGGNDDLDGDAGDDCIYGDAGDDNADGGSGSYDFCDAETETTCEL